MSGAFAACAQAVSLQRLEPVVHVLVDLILGEAVALLQLAFELVAPALDDVEIVVGELAPFLLGGALELLPVSFDPVPIHCHLLLRFHMANQPAGHRIVPGARRPGRSSRANAARWLRPHRTLTGGAD